MALNPNIALGVRGIEIGNPLAQYAQVSQIQNAQNQNALAQFQLGAAQRTEKSQNLLADAYAQSTDPATGKIDYNKLTGLVAAGGGGTQIPAIQKSRFEQESAGTKLLADKLALLPEAYKRADTPEAYLALHQSVHADPILGPWLKSTGATPEKGLAALQNAVQTGKFDDLRMGSMQSVSQLLESMKPISVAAGSSVFDPRSKSFTQAPAAPERTDTDLIRNFNAAKAQGFTGTIFDYERKIKEAGRTPAQAAAPTITTVEDPTAPGKFLQVDARTYRGGGANAPGVIGSARPSALSEKTTTQRTQMGKDLGFAITQLSDITKDGGLIDQSTGSGAGRLADVGAGFFGKATEGAIAIGKIAPIADLVLKMVPRFEGPQSNKDTQSYKEAAGQLADATLPTKIRKEAGKTVLRLMQERRDQFVTRDMAAEGAGGGGVDTSNPLLK